MKDVAPRMADLSYMETERLERCLRMGDGYVLDFSNRTFQEFILDSSGLGIYDAKYDYESGSKAVQGEPTPCLLEEGTESCGWQARSRSA